MMRGEDVTADAQDDDEDLENVSDEERREAEALARALDAPPADPDPGSLAEVAARLRLVRGVSAAPALEPSARRAMVEAAVASGRARRRRRAIVGGLAAAAGIALAIGVGGAASYAGQLGAGPEPLRYGGPTSALFGEPFDDAQASSARLDRITRARSRDYFGALAERAGGRP